jgi:hypothetical protein
MLFAQTFFYLLMGLGTALGLPALWLFTRARWPGLVERGKEVSTRRLTVSLLLGLPVLVLAGVLAKLMSGTGNQMAQLATVALLGGTLLWALAGTAGLATHVGESLWPEHREGPQAWRATWRGGLVVVGCLLIPFLGWFFLLILLPILGAGLQVRGWFVRVPPKAAVVPPEAAGTQETVAGPPALPMPGAGV